jgi:signal transduction protein with GAF and PtsI domain
VKQNKNKFKKEDIPDIKKRKHNQLSLLFEINEYINETDDIKVILKGILNIIKDYFNDDILILYLWNSEINKIVLETSTEKDMSLEYNPEEGLAGTIFHIKQSINSINIIDHSQYKNIFKNDEEKVCYFGIPILLKAECIGVLEIWNKKGNSISHNQQKTIQIICSRLSGLLEVSKILERFKTPKRIDQTATFYGIPISNGISIGRAYIIPELLRNEYLKIDHSCTVNIENEKNRLTEGFANAIQELSILIKNLRENRSISESEINIFQAHLMILQDQSFLNILKEHIDKKKLKAEICLSEYNKRFSKTIIN